MEGQHDACRIAELATCLKERGLFSLVKRRLRGDPSSFLTPESSIPLHRGAQDKGQLEYVSSGEILSKRKIFSTVKTTRYWNILPREVVGVSSIEVFKTWLGRALDFKRKQDISRGPFPA